MYTPIHPAIRPPGEFGNIDGVLVRISHFMESRSYFFPCTLVTELACKVSHFVKVVRFRRASRACGLR